MPPQRYDHADAVMPAGSRDQGPGCGRDGSASGRGGFGYGGGFGLVGRKSGRRKSSAKVGD
jgi:hypothetical protein